ncbi:MAG: hypothetical protein H8E05_00675 [Bacteroidetes bacterium]|nr:hypothetical protein [Bacteroidota bacterium]
MKITITYEIEEEGNILRKTHRKDYSEYDLHSLDNLNYYYGTLGVEIIDWLKAEMDKLESKENVLK